MDVSSPRATLESFVKTTVKPHPLTWLGILRKLRSYVKNLLQCLNLDQELPDLKQAIGFESILYLVEVLHRIEMPPYTDIPDLKAVQDQKITSWTIPHTPITIGLVKDQLSTERFLFTPDTVKQAPEFYNSVKQLPYLWGTEGMGAYHRAYLPWGPFYNEKSYQSFSGLGHEAFWRAASVAVDRFDLVLPGRGFDYSVNIYIRSKSAGGAGQKISFRF